MTKDPARNQNGRQQGIAEGTGGGSPREGKIGGTATSGTSRFITKKLPVGKAWKNRFLPLLLLFYCSGHATPPFPSPRHANVERPA